MDEVFIGPKELTLAAVGMGIAALLLVFLSIYKKARMREGGEERLRRIELEGQGPVNVPPGETPFFIASYLGSHSRFFRVYRGTDELLFLHAGDFFFLIDDETPRATGEKHWLLRSFKLVIVGLTAVAVMASLGVGMVLRVLARNMGENPEGAADLLTWILGIVAVCAAIVVVGIPLTLWNITRRCRQLDAMTLCQLREESELHPKCLRATRDTVSQLKFALMDQEANFFATSELGSLLSFKHAPTGRWSIQLRSKRDIKDAIQACLAIWGREPIQIDQPLLDRLGEVAGLPASRQ